MSNITDKEFVHDLVNYHYNQMNNPFAIGTHQIYETHLVCLFE